MGNATGDGGGESDAVRDPDRTPHTISLRTASTQDLGTKTELAKESPRPDRYRLLGKLGLGGMGEVTRAYDLKLDRHVALKRVRYRSRTSRDRLIREAQALARLSHPNVVSVYDVEIIDNKAYMAMELVEGVSLKRWLAQAPRSVRSIVKVFAQAGAGLAAAHDAGLIHRDFKLSNVVVGSDGRARVLDFGLARWADESRSSELSQTGSEAGEDSGGDDSGFDRLLDVDLTAANSVVGTPSYMAPEQHRGESVSPAGDVFAFGVSLYAALYGRNPFAGDSSDEIRAEILAGKPRPPARRRGVPRRLAALVMGCLLADAAERATMAELLTELRRDPWRRKKQAGVAFAGVGLVAVAVFGLLRDSPDTRCQGAEARLDGVWDQPRRQGLRQALLRSERSYAADTATLVESLFDSYASGWVTAHTATCAATHRDGTQSEQTLDLRMRCLDERLAEVGALVAALSRDDNPAAVDRAVEAASSLAPLSICDDVAALARALPLPADAGLRARVEALMLRVRDADAIAAAGNIVGAVELADAILADARRIDYAPVQAAAVDLRASLFVAGGDADAAEALYRELITVASAAQADDALVRGWIGVIRTIGLDRGKLAEAIELRPWAEAAMLRAGNRLEYQAPYQSLLALLARRQGRAEDALAHNQRSLEMWSELFGSESPAAATALNNIGGTLIDLGRFDDALDYFQHALAVSEKALGRDHPEVATPLTNIARVLIEGGELDRAEPHLVRALAIKEASFGPDHPRLSATLNTLSMLATKRDQFDKALGYQRRQLGIDEKVLGPEHRQLGIGHYNVGYLLLEKGRFADARYHVERARSIFVPSVGEKHTFVGYADVALSRCDTGQGHPQRGLDRIAPLIRALEDKDRTSTDLADARFARALALFALGKRRQARKAARLALDAYRAAGPGSTGEVRTVSAWLEQN